MSSQLLRKPAWLRMKIPSGQTYKKVRDLKKELSLTTVCEEARCPNIGQCWEKAHATFMLFGSQCTRACRFCDVDTSRKPDPVDLKEPEKIAAAAAEMNVRYAVITSVNRDDLVDGGSGLFAQTVHALKEKIPSVLVELLTPDFKGQKKLIATVLDSKPEVFGHNLETSRRMHPTARPQSNYDFSLKVLQSVKTINSDVVVKSAFMVGLGETDQEVFDMIQDLKSHDVDIIHIGQYLRPSKRHLEVDRYVHPDQFKKYEDFALNCGIKAIKAGAFVRSSYLAEETYRELKS